jgi:hypothetical protein
MYYCIVEECFDGGINIIIGQVMINQMEKHFSAYYL